MKDLPHEVWRDVVGYEGLYEVSSFGRVRSVDRIVRNRYGVRVSRGKILTPSLNDGYLFVSLCNKCKYKTKYVHRLVAEAFIPNPNNLPQINHKDETRDNNRVDNLEWCDSKYNNNYGTKVQRSIDRVGFPVSQYLPDGTFVKSYRSTLDAARETGISRSAISTVARGVVVSNGHSLFVRKSAGGYVWRVGQIR